MMRKSKEQYYIDIVKMVASRSTCNRGRAGAIIVKDGRILSTGFAGSPSKMEHCDDAGHWFQERYDVVEGNLTRHMHCIRTIHAEMNAILQIAKYGGPPIDGASIWTTMFPCFDCAKAIVNVGIVEVFCLFDYHRSMESKQLFHSAKIPWTIFYPDVLPRYESDTEQI